MKIGNNEIGAGRTYIIAELSANHNHSFEIAAKTIIAAAAAGADAIKLQTYTADTITIDCNNNDFSTEESGPWAGQTLYELYKKAYTPWEWHPKLQEIAKENGLDFFSSPFDPTSVEFLEKLNVPAYKIASFEITDIPLIELVASKGKPVIISTGVASEEDIQLALDTCRSMGNDQIVLLKCTSSYPAPIEEANVIMIKDMAERYGVITGLSDHTIGSTVPIVSVCYGAKIIEKHFILDRSIGGPDASFSMNEEEFTNMVQAIREAEKAIGIVNYSLTDKQQKGRGGSRSLYVVQDIKCGELITEKNVRSIRPGHGLHPKYYKEALGTQAIQDFKKGDRFKL